MPRLRRLAEQRDYPALQTACHGLDGREPAVQVLRALAAVHLGDARTGQQTIATLDRRELGIDVRVDLAAVRMALGELDEAISILEAARREDADHALLLARLAWCRLQQGRHDEALTLYERSLALRPFLAAHLQVLRLYLSGGRHADLGQGLQAACRFWAQDQADWPDDQRQAQGRQLRGLHLDLWLAREETAAAEAWVEGQRDALSEDDWCALLSDFSRRLAACDRHDQAEEWLRTGLRRYPDNLELHVELAELARLQGRAYQAVALLRRAIRVAAARNQSAVELWTTLSATALHVDPALARSAAVRARDELGRLTESSCRTAGELADLGLHVELALASVDAREQDFVGAEHRYRQILEQRPHSATAALHGLGQVFMQLGRIDEAVALFERVKDTDPTRGHGALIHARRFPADVEALHRLERLARTPGAEGSVRTGLLFQLAAAWEDRGDCGKAFALADEANAAARRLLRYAPEAHRQRCARIRHAFSEALLEHRAGAGHDTTLPVFIVGMPRSGTTLVEQIIAGHSRIHGAGELGAIPGVIAGLERWERHTGSGRRYPDCVDDLDTHVTRGIAARVLTELRSHAPEALHVVDKLPHNFENIGLISMLFPRAKIISVRRDPRDVAVSNFFTDYAARHAGMGFAYDLTWIGEQLADHDRLMRHWQQLWPGGILEIAYEDVVDDPENSARRLLEHIGVDWEPQVLDFATLQRPVRTASVWQVRQPLYASSKGRWLRYRQQLAPLLEAAGRPITGAPIDMVTLPEPGWLNTGVDRYRAGDLDTAEDRFERLLQHLPEHAAARFLLGLIRLRRGRPGDGIALMEQALQRCPWNRRWRSDLARAYRMHGRNGDAAALDDDWRTPPPTGGTPPAKGDRAEAASPHDYLFSSGESTCASFGPATSGAAC